jgi:hypothetical protein
VSLTRRPEEIVPAELSGIAGVLYLPSLDRGSVLAVLEGARRPRGVDVPQDALLAISRQSATLH